MYSLEDEILNVLTEFTKQKSTLIFMVRGCSIPARMIFVEIS
jgi:hypothetical protein